MTAKDLKTKFHEVNQLIKDKAPDTEIINAQIKAVISNKELLNKVMDSTGIYDKNGNLTSNFK